MATNTTAGLLGLLGNVGTLAIGSVGIYVALRNQHRQLNAQLFIEFSRRFQDLLRLFPTEAWLANHNSLQPLPPSSQQLTECTLYAMQFIADVYHLHQGGYIARGLWKLWELQIRKTLSGRVFQREWERIADEFAHIPSFVEYIHGAIHSDRAAVSSTDA